MGMIWKVDSGEDWHRILRAVLTCRHIAPSFNNYLARNYKVIKRQQIVG